MTKEDFLEAMNDIDEGYIREAHEYKANPSRGVYTRLAALAACVVIAVSAYAAVALNRDDLPVEKPPVDEDPIVTEVPDEEVNSSESMTTTEATTRTTADSSEVTTSEATGDVIEEDVEIDYPAEEDLPYDYPPVESDPDEEYPVEEAPVWEDDEVEVEAPVEESESDFRWPTLPDPDDPSVAGLLEVQVNRADENPGSGEPISYDHYMDERFAIRDDLQLLSYEITKVYTPEEAVEIMGEGSEDYYMGITALYEIHVYYDHIAEEAVDYTVLMSRAGNQLRQWAGCPIFGVGERYMSIIYDTEQFDMLPVMSFYLEEEYAYYIDTLSSPECLLCPVDEADPDMNIPMGEDEWWRITTTKNNPVIFHRKFKTDALAEYIRADWQGRRE